MQKEIDKVVFQTKSGEKRRAIKSLIELIEVIELEKNHASRIWHGWFELFASSFLSDSPAQVPQRAPSNHRDSLTGADCRLCGANNRCQLWFASDVPIACATLLAVWVGAFYHNLTSLKQILAVHRNRRAQAVHVESVFTILLYNPMCPLSSTIAVLMQIWPSKNNLSDYFCHTQSTSVRFCYSHCQCLFFAAEITGQVQAHQAGAKLSMAWSSARCHLDQ